MESSQFLTSWYEDDALKEKDKSIQFLWQFSCVGHATTLTNGFDGERERERENIKSKQNQQQQRQQIWARSKNKHQIWIVASAEWGGMAAEQRKVEDGSSDAERFEIYWPLNAQTWKLLWISLVSKAKWRLTESRSAEYGGEVSRRRRRRRRRRERNL